MKKRLLALLLAIVLALGLILAGTSYFSFVSRTIYDKSIAHLTEIFHQANQALNSLVSVNWSRMRMWAPYLETAQSEAYIVAYVNQAREECNFTNFFFISRNGDYITLEGKRGYLDLQGRLANLILDRAPVVANSVVPDQPEIMVFAIPTAPGSFRNFAYEAIAVTYNNADLVETLKISTFAGQASTFAAVPDGRIVVDNGSEDMEDIHNFFALLEKSSSLSEEQLAALREDFLAGRSGAAAIDIDGKAYYLVYESADFQDWTADGSFGTYVNNHN